MTNRVGRISLAFGVWRGTCMGLIDRYQSRLWYLEPEGFVPVLCYFVVARSLSQPASCHSPTLQAESNTGCIPKNMYSHKSGGPEIPYYTPKHQLQVKMKDTHQAAMLIFDQKARCISPLNLKQHYCNIQNLLKIRTKNIKKDAAALP